MSSIRCRRLVAVGSAAALAASVLFGLPAYACSGPYLPQQLAIPAYFSPGDTASWSELASVGWRLGFVVANVSNGPGPAADPAWQGVLDRLNTASATVVGYVDTGYFGFTGRQTRTGATDAASWLAQAEQDVDAWYAFYGDDIGGIFFDSAESSCGPTDGSTAYADLYRQLSDYVHSRYPDSRYPGSMTIDNAGQSVSECYADAADALVTFEGDYAAYVNPTGAQVPQPWQLTADPDKFVNLVFNVPADQVAAAIARSKKDNATYVYLTDRTFDSNPWLAAPPWRYFRAELAAAAR